MNKTKALTQTLNIFDIKSNENRIKANSLLNNIKENNKQLYVSSSRDINLAGIIKHFPPANKEWFNSIYAYNKNYIKLLPSIDKTTYKLIKGHFNSYSRILEKKVKKARPRRYRVRKMRLSTNRILVSRAELKHTNDRVIITVYIYNNEKKYLYNKIQNIPTIDQWGKLLGGWTIREQLNFISSKVNKYVNKILGSGNINDITLTKLNKFTSKKEIIYDIYSFFSRKFREGSYFSEFPKPVYHTIKRKNGKDKKKNINKSGYSNENKETLQTKIHAEIWKRRRFLNKIPSINNFLLNKLNEKTSNLISKIKSERKGLYNFINNNEFTLGRYKNKSMLNLYETKYVEDYVCKFLRRETISMYFKQLIGFNKLKFEKQYVSHLTNEIDKIYGKKVEFNFVNLKHLYLSGSIFSNTLVAKIRNRKNKLLRVMKDSLLMFNLPPINRQAVYNEIYNKKMVMQNPRIGDVTNKYLINNTPLTNVNKNDILDDSIFSLVSHSNFTNKIAPEINDYAHKLSLVLGKLKHKSVTGVRIEVAGRLTKRNTAARSLFKLRYKGNIKNLDSSNKGLSTIMLRGHAKSNLEYSTVKSKIRTGSYGFKGWVSSG